MTGEPYSTENIPPASEILATLRQACDVLDRMSSAIMHPGGVNDLDYSWTDEEDAILEEILAARKGVRRAISKWEAIERGDVFQLPAQRNATAS